MQKYLCILLFVILGCALMACTVTEVSEHLPQEEITTIVTTRPLSSPIASQPSSVPTETTTTTSTSVPTATDMPETTPTPAATLTATPDYTPVLVATIEPAPYRRSFLPENVWWSEDSQTLYYQDIEAQEAWAYDLSTQSSTSIAYVPRSLRELEPQIQASLPENASIVSLSPENQFVLYRIPLAEPIPIPEDPTLNPTPEFKVPNSYTAELWLRKDGQDFNLGLVDTCFGLHAPPLWSTNENVVIVNGVGSDGIACLHPVWLIDLEALSLEPLDSPWTENYEVLDLSANGDVFLVSPHTDRLNYLYDSTTNERWGLDFGDPERDGTARMRLIESGQSQNCLIFELEFSDTILRDHLWYCEPTTGEINFLSYN